MNCSVPRVNWTFACRDVILQIKYMTSHGRYFTWLAKLISISYIWPCLYKTVGNVCDIYNRLCDLICCILGGICRAFSSDGKPRTRQSGYVIMYESTFWSRGRRGYSRDCFIFLLVQGDAGTFIKNVASPVQREILFRIAALYRKKISWNHPKNR